MDFVDKISQLSARIPNMLDKILSEEGTKTCLVMPFIEALGYTVSDPADVTPEFTADVGTRKGEKVDYALLIQGKPVILIECKHHTTDLKNALIEDIAAVKQLFRYFTTLRDAKFGIVTNGIQYMFYTDLDEPNLMDNKPFFEFDITDIKAPALEELKKFCKSEIDLSSMTETALELKHKKQTKELLLNQLRDPSPGLVSFVASNVLVGKNFRKVTESWQKKFAEYTKWALNEIIREKLTQSLNTALNSRIESEAASGSDQATEIVSPADKTDTKPSTIESDGLEMTPEQWGIYYIIRTILREVIQPKRVSARKAKTYFGILLDNTTHKPICHLHLDDDQKDIVFFDKQGRERVVFKDLDDLYKYADRLKESVAIYQSITAVQDQKG